MSESVVLRDGERTGLTALIAALFLLVCLAHVTGLRNVVAFAVALWAAVYVIRARRVPPLALPMCAWFIVGAASALWALSGVDAIKAASYDILFPAGAFYAAYIVAGRRACFRALAASIIGGTILLAAFTAIDWLVVRAGMPELYAALMRYYPGEGTASTMCVYGLPFALMLASERSARARLVGYMGVFCMMLAGIATHNRMFWLSALVVLAAFWGWQWRIFNLRQRLAAALTLTGGAALAFAMVLRLTGAGHEAVSVIAQDNRPAAWREWAKIAAEAPVLGYGLGLKNLKEAGITKLPAEFVQSNLEMRFHAHSLFLDVILQTGLVGLAIYCFLIVNLAREGWRGPATPQRGALGAALLALLAGMLAKNAADDFMHHGVVIAFWGYAGVLVGRLRSDPPAIGPVM